MLQRRHHDLLLLFVTFLLSEFVLVSPQGMNFYPNMAQGQGQGQGFRPGQGPQTPVQHNPPRTPVVRQPEPPAQNPPPQNPPPQNPPAPGHPAQVPAGQRPLQPSAPIHVKYLILGAGAAGLQAAETLVNKGEHNFLILEASSTYGGRVRDIPFAGVRVEAGADTPRPKSDALDSAIRGLGAKLRIHKPDWQSLSIISEQGHTNLTNVARSTHLWPRTAHAVVESLNLAEELWESHDSDMSVRAALKSIGWFPKNGLERTMEWLHFDYQLGDVPRVTSLKSHAFDAPELIIQRGPNADPPRVVTDQKGFKSYFDEQLLFMRTPTHRSKILYNKYVVQVEYGSPLSVTVRCTDGTVYQADWVISTFSLGVLQHKVVNFVPAFPGWKTRELNRFVMGAHTKIFLEFPNTFWGNKEFILRVAERRGHFPLLTDLKTRIPELQRHEKHVLLVEVTGDEARRIDGQSVSRTKQEIMRTLRRMFPFRIPDPLDMYVSGWNSNPLFMGSHSLWSPAVEPKCFAKVQSRLGRLLFAGEYTSLRFSGHVQGAIQSGKREADKAYLCSTGGTCPQWTEGLQCACTGTTPTQLHGGARMGAHVTSWMVGAAVVAAIFIGRVHI
ncbi:polyamine oxidase 1-like [Asterias rubens]|uniref:polyamine oxidase 1-like n=1 Tax=Asterias rubens TaxID=7604 RepID=UPI001455D179|nr:polyamine oxidase 1-like [Asterias rubens]